EPYNSSGVADGQVEGSFSKGLAPTGAMATTTTATTSYFQRLIGAAALDPGVYEEVEADETATTQAFLTVVLSSAAAGIGARGFGGDPVVSFVFVSIVSLL